MSDDPVADLKADIAAEMALRHPVKEEKVEEQKVEESVVDESKIEEVKIPDADPFLDEALKQGYDPNFKGENKKSPEQFVKDGSYFKKIASQNKKIEELTELVKQSLSHTTKLEKASYEKALRELESAKLDAVKNADEQRYKIVEEQQKIVHQQMQEVERNAPNVAPKITQELLDFQERNKEWFNNQTEENKDMVEAADFVDRMIAKQAVRKGIQISQNEHLKMVEDAVKKQFPERFRNSNQDKPVLVAKSTVSGSPVKKDLSDKLSAQQKEFVTTARKYGSKLTNEEYAKQLKITGDLKDE